MTPATLAPGNTTISNTNLDDLAIEINQHHGSFCEAFRRALPYARRAGDLLRVAKAELDKHGAWLPWLREHCPDISPQVAARYMRISRRWSELESNAYFGTHLGINKALALLAERTADDPGAAPAESSSPLERIEHVPVDMLKPHPRNYKTHPDEQIDHIMRSIEEHGFYRNVVIARDNTILAGHGIVEAVRKMGSVETVPVIRLDLDPDDPRALKVLTGDNELGKVAETDLRGLSEVLRDVFKADDLNGTGFDAQSLAALVMVSPADRRDPGQERSGRMDRHARVRFRHAAVSVDGHVPVKRTARGVHEPDRHPAGRHQS